MRIEKITAGIDGAHGPVPVKIAGTGQDLYLFDLEALVPSVHGRMDPGLEQYVTDFAEKHPCYIVTSYGYHVVLRTLPEHVRCVAAGIYAASGAEIWKTDQPVHQEDHLFRDSLYEFMAQVVQRSTYPDKKAPLLDVGPASLRLDIPGQRATVRERQAYLRWENTHSELANIVHEFTARFPDYQICRDGMTSLLITHRNFSARSTLTGIKADHPEGRILGYFRPSSLAGYAADMAAGLQPQDLIAEVNGPSDLAQLLKYEERRHDCAEPALPNALLDLLEL
ncbi:hypothetical protein JM93_02967 [Roseibium hamelinense]|uniref:Uncharacterized protein n=1 Tax=Roseibium hamelinense TaxID=150831 RepID=A0A562STP8_9HYPH|nr:hypothetical protein [Roseibium hamelinense]MTI43062.1 hypothetical protein [Roseibium hamelinense]TWI84635.1 hypothetical protein JM93_02967 [Roseibium hamelinense]